MEGKKNKGGKRNSNKQQKGKVAAKRGPKKDQEESKASSANSPWNAVQTEAARVNKRPQPKGKESPRGGKTMKRKRSDSGKFLSFNFVLSVNPSSLNLRMGSLDLISF